MYVGRGGNGLVDVPRGKITVNGNVYMATTAESAATIDLQWGRLYVGGSIDAKHESNSRMNMDSVGYGGEEAFIECPNTIKLNELHLGRGKIKCKTLDARLTVVDGSSIVWPCSHQSVHWRFRLPPYGCPPYRPGLH